MISIVALPQLLILMLIFAFDSSNDDSKVDETSFAKHIFSSQISLRYLRSPNYLSHNRNKNMGFCLNRDKKLVPLPHNCLGLYGEAWNILPFFRNATMFYEVLGMIISYCNEFKAFDSFCGEDNAKDLWWTWRKGAFTGKLLTKNEYTNWRITLSFSGHSGSIGMVHFSKAYFLFECWDIVIHTAVQCLRPITGINTDVLYHV